MSWKIYPEYDLRTQTYEIYISNYDRNLSPGKLFRIKIEEIENSPYISITTTDPAFKLYKEDAHDLLRAFINAAWEMGIKPTAYHLDNKELEATKYHLEDMRTLTLKKE